MHQQLHGVQMCQIDGIPICTLSDKALLCLDVKA